ncbi:probable LRR receptor-like serine/threonine-protein kinase At2g24230 [Magnolia sinica]|uniref:probable LRR receptor-like serine/threonine-protein kinase At2g24230 n=1 Tax=Magnolia sinica TaxID=86752 RepID=UPI00265888C9|nr:probable LRR receptor-like serine/threonine-protein kinase At2g24230 [Magnolia sinica]
MGFAPFASFLVLSLIFRTSASQEPNTDGFFLSDFMQKMGLNSSTQNLSAPVCSWNGVTCDTQGANVISLAISGYSLSGLIPENTIGKLSKLQFLDLSSNRITGFSSDFWGLGNTLKSLNLSSNQINGSLPNTIGNFGLLEYLNLSQNMFGGSIPSELLNCKALVSVDLSSNQLNGSVPNGFGPAFENLTILNLAGNAISGRILDFEGLKSVSYLNLSGNEFQGPVTGVFAEALQVIDLSRNRFQGHISQVHFNSRFNWSVLVFVDMSENQLSGQFFNGFNQARSLKHLNFAHNRFSRQKFPRLENLFQLEYLNLSKTSLIGHIPTEISQLSGLATLDLSQNHLTADIPHLSIDGLQVLDLSQNNLTGEIPMPLLEKLPEMEKFNFSYNNLSLCAAKFSPETFRTAFFGSQDNCPIAANPNLLKKKDTKHRGLKLALAIALSVFCFLVGLACLAFGCRRKTRMWAVKQLSYKEEPNISGPFSFQTDLTTWVADVKVATSVAVIIFDKPLLNFTFADLLSATSHFDRGTLLAEGRFGPVYRGFLPGAIHVAVKVLVHGSTVTNQEAAREFEHVGRIKHPNLVPLVGYCLAGDQRIALYEYMENGNLQNLLHDLPLGVQRTEDWSTDTWEEEGDGVQNVASEGLTTWAFRHKIALGTARALAFLHHGCFPQIIHRDVKASSIYLSSELEPRLSDFGLAKIVGSSLEEELSRGSTGYSPPEFSQLDGSSSSSSATSKSDVYGFGVVLFELITGKKVIGDDYPDEKDSNLVTWVRRLVRKNQSTCAIDPKIRGTGSETQMVEALRIGYLCTADSPSKRPSMQQIVGLLKDIEPISGQ